VSDFRGPNGIWTKEQQRLKEAKRQKRANKSKPAAEAAAPQAEPSPLPKSEAETTTTPGGLEEPSSANNPSFELATPTLTHMAIKGLLDAGKIAYVSSQNVDSLHLRSGIPRDSLSELHGNLFTEICTKCGHEWLREADIGGVGLTHTGLTCEAPTDGGGSCGGPLRDNCLDWDDALPEVELARTEAYAESSKLSIVLGSSLRIEPAASICVATADEPEGQVAIVNLQVTPKDDRASLKINAKCDEVMALVMAEIGVPIPIYQRNHDVQATWTLITGKLHLSVAGLDGRRIPAAAACEASPSWEGSGSAITTTVSPFRFEFCIPEVGLDPNANVSLRITLAPQLVAAGASKIAEQQCQLGTTDEGRQAFAIEGARVAY